MHNGSYTHVLSVYCSVSQVQITIFLTSDYYPLLHRLPVLGGEHAVVGGGVGGPGQGAALTRGLVTGTRLGLAGHWHILRLEKSNILPASLRCCVSQYLIFTKLLSAIQLGD